jgi:NADPH:quinone reductase-like Zn-dependent oxidoreductase
MFVVRSVPEPKPDQVRVRVHFKKKNTSQVLVAHAVILATQEAKIRRITV